jgi:hypothetical protein
VLARKRSRRSGRCCIRLSRVLTSAVSWLRLRLAMLARDLFRCDQTGSTGLSSRAQDGSRQAVSQSPGGDQLGHRSADVGAQIVPDDHERPAGLQVRGGREAGAVRLGEALALVFAPAAAGVHAVDQPGPAARLVHSSAASETRWPSVHRHPRHPEPPAAPPGRWPPPRLTPRPPGAPAAGGSARPRSARRHRDTS